MRPAITPLTERPLYESEEDLRGRILALDPISRWEYRQALELFKAIELEEYGEELPLRAASHAFSLVKDRRHAWEHASRWSGRALRPPPQRLEGRPAVS